MTTTIAPGDLVLRDRKAEGPVTAVTTTGLHYSIAPDGARYEWPLCSSATRIGSTRDGWKVHTGSERPADVGAKDVVAYAMRKMYGDPVARPSRAGSLKWGEYGAETIVAYRIVQRAEPPISGQGGNCGAADDTNASVTATNAKVSSLPFDTMTRTAAPEPRQVPVSELRAGDRVRVTVEHTLVRRDDKLWVTDDNGWLGDDVTERATIHLLSREPEPLKVNDDCRLKGTAEPMQVSEELDHGTIIRVRWFSGGGKRTLLTERDNLERIP